MAILKHRASHNPNYHDFITYVLFQHDNHARPIYDHNHVKMLRENVLIDAINTTPWTFNIDCHSANRQWRKNRDPRDVTQHRFILAFSPEDQKRGLTVEKAQALGMEFARRNFGGHQCVVATHDDGNNKSGSIHCHISFNSLRVKDIPQPPYSKLERDGKAGYKFHNTPECLRYLKADVERMCRENGLHQVELNKKAKQNVPDKEYWAEHRGQERLDQKNDAIRSIGGKPAETKFQTELARMRQAIDESKQNCDSVEDFIAVLKRNHNITVSESRGRWSYLPEYRQKPITSRRLGDDYSKEAIEAYITQRLWVQMEQQAQAEAERQKQKQEQIPQAKPVIKVEKKQEPKPSRPVIQSVTIGRIIDLNDPKIQASYGLTQWAKIQNLKSMSMSFNYLTENNLLNMDRLQDTIKAERSDFNQDTQELLTVEKKLNTCNMLLKNLGIYHKFRPIHQQYIQSRKSAKFKEQHMRELLLYDGAVKKLHEYQERHNCTTVPNMKDLQYWKSQLVPQQQELYERRRRAKQEIKTMEDGYNLLKQLEHQVQRQPNLHKFVERE